MKKKLILPKFKNNDEELMFWSKIDLSDYYDADDFKRFDIDELFDRDNNRNKTSRITMRLPEKLIHKVKQQAQSLDVPYQSLMKIYIQQGTEK